MVPYQGTNKMHAWFRERRLGRALLSRTRDERRNFLRARSFPYQHISADTRRFRQLRGTATVLAILQAA